MQTLLSVNNYHYRRDGSEVVYFEHNQAFESAGWSVIPFSMQHSENESSEYSSFFVEEMEFGQSYSLSEKIRRVPKLIYSRESQRRISDLIEFTKPDIAHCHTIYHHLSPSVLSVLKKYHLPTVMTLHDLKLGCPAYHMHTGEKICEQCKGGNLRNVVKNRCIKDSSLFSSLIYLESRLHKMLGSYTENVDYFIAPCQFYIDKLVEWGWDRSKFRHIPNSLSPEKFFPSYKDRDGYILYFGRLSPEKGLLTLIEAAVKSKVPVVLAGDGPQEAKLRKKVSDLDAPVTFLGRLEISQLEKTAHKACATVLPSEWYENAPMSILESFAWGTPVLGANIGGIPEMIEHQKNGLLFDSGSTESLASAMLEIVGLNQARRTEMGRFARATLEEKFSTSRYLQTTSSLYQELS